MLTTMNARYFRSLKVLLTALLGLMIIPVVLQILSRFVEFIPRYIWTEEAARFCFVWMIMIGSIIAVREGTHFDVDLFPNIESAKWKSVFRMLVQTFMLLMAFVFIVYGYDFARLGYAQSSETMGINMLSIYIAFPIAGVSWMFFILENLIKDFGVMKSRTGETQL
jgi:TRAP-type C4-dicarboxylate transport system permease small subunit